MSNLPALAAIVAALSAIFGFLADPRDRRQFLKMFLVSAALLITLMGLGAVFGKTLGDFLRGVNG